MNNKITLTGITQPFYRTDDIYDYVYPFYSGDDEFDVINCED